MDKEQIIKEVDNFLQDPVFGKLLNRNAAIALAQHIHDLTWYNQWISVDEELPPINEDVFVRYEMLYPKLPTEVGFCVRWRTKDKTVRIDKNQFSIIGDMEITHWMPIPRIGGEDGKP